MALIAKKYHGKIADLHHYGHIVAADANGKILWQLGEPERVTYSRSSAKPMQAIPLVESGAVDEYGITEKELAVMCASHSAEDFHTEAVLSILKKAGLDESWLQCGTHYPLAAYMENKFKANGITPTPIHSNCSGKHAGMLITAKIRGESLNDYYLPSHPLQKRITETIAEICEYPADKIVIALDGCGVPVHALPLYKFAQGYARMSKPEMLGPDRERTVRRITSAMTNYPEMVGGTGNFTTELMQAFGGRLFCKTGASAFFAVGLKGKGIGIVMKMEDGNSNIIPLAMLETLVQIGEITPDEALSLPSYKGMIGRNHKNEVIGRTVTDFVLEKIS
ncbi:MAG: asparaginase [Synergistaceae bacterium]|nr:asparaginase [Synergistaceae bacterium]